MSILRLEAAPFHPVDARYIDTLDLLVTNIGSESFDMLVHGYNPYGVFYVGQIQLDSGASVSIPGIGTYHMPFTLLLVTNYHTYHTTGVLLTAKNEGSVVALFNQEQFARMH